MMLPCKAEKYYNSSSWFCLTQNKLRKNVKPHLRLKENKITQNLGNRTKIIL